MRVHNPPAVDFPALLQRFFGERLIHQQNASKHTVAAYRDTFRLLLRYIYNKFRIAPSDLTFEHLSPDTITAFLQYVETERRNSIRTRNARLAAIRSFLHYAVALDPSSIATIQRVLAIPMKRFHRPIVGFLSREEISAVLDAPDLQTWSGRRDRALFMTLYNTGARVSEIIGVVLDDLDLGRCAFLTLHGKGRKERTVPLWRGTVRELKKWIDELVSSKPDTSLFPAASGKKLSRSGVEHRLQLAVMAATSPCPSLKNKVITPHTIRHTTAMHLLKSGVDLSVIALWLGHESPTTTHMYMEADLAMKQRALASLDEPSVRRANRYRPSDKLLQFLEAL
jgi:site-specific recombinase XerD